MKCPQCNKEMVKIGYYTNKRGKYQKYKCQECGISRVDFSKNLRL
jgi:transposase-like protein